MSRAGSIRDDSWSLVSMSSTDDSENFGSTSYSYDSGSLGSRTSSDDSGTYDSMASPVMILAALTPQHHQLWKKNSSKALSPPEIQLLRLLRLTATPDGEIFYRGCSIFKYHPYTFLFWIIIVFINGSRAERALSMRNNFPTFVYPTWPLLMAALNGKNDKGNMEWRRGGGN